jgi:hypothetical protein
VVIADMLDVLDKQAEVVVVAHNANRSHAKLTVRTALQIKGMESGQ